MSPRANFRIASVLCAAVILGVLLAQATTMELLSLKALTAYSSHVVRGKFVKLESMWTKDRSAIYTRAVFRVEETVAGEPPGDEIVVYLPGGQVGDTTTLVIGAPEVELGKEALLMLSEVAPGPGAAAPVAAQPAFSLVGLSQGIFDIKRDPKTNQMMAVSQAAKLFVRPAELEEGIGLPPGGTEGIPVEELKRRIHDIRGRAPELMFREAKEAEDEERAAEKKEPEEEGVREAGEGEEGEVDEEAKEEGTEDDEEPDEEEDEAEGEEEEEQP